MSPRPVQPAPAPARARGRGLWPALVAAVLMALAPLAGRAQVNQLPQMARGVDVEEHLGRFLPFDVQFTDSAGRLVAVGDYFGKASAAEPRKPLPAIVALVYYECPVACAAVMEKLAACLNELDYTVGKDFNCLVFSFKPEETTPMAAGLKARYLVEYNKPLDTQVRAGWEFHTGSATASRELADAFGFPYRDVGNGQYSHPIAIFIVSPEGKIVRYIYGFDYPPAQVKLALIEASEGRIARSLGDKLAGVCFKWDGNAGKYTLSVIRLTQVAGAITVTLVAALVSGFLIHERIKRRRAGPGLAV
ncbi:MAG: SCO family protein [Phycisphaerales bacterium]|nr:SCO family protein [Phycisphaerales bacterium]